MPQVWVTFEEIADLFYSDTAGARRRVVGQQWERRKCSDGQVRALLPREVAHEFMLHHRSKQELSSAPADDFDAAMAALRRVFTETGVGECEDGLVCYRQAS